MKSIFIGLLAIACVQVIYAQSKHAVPEKVKAAFAKEYARIADVKWEKEKGLYEASFKENGNKLSVLYSANGDVVERETAIPVEQLPERARKYATAKGKITEAAKIVKADGKVQYETEVKHKDLQFDEQGNFINEGK